MKNATELFKMKLIKKKRKLGDPMFNRYVLKFKDIMMAIVKEYRQRKGGKVEISAKFLQRNMPKAPSKEIF